MGKNISEILIERMEEKGLTLEKLKIQTGISDRFMDALFSGTYDNLPASPYVRGYVLNLARVLGMDGEVLWASYKESLNLRKSGLEDKLPVNRFAIDGKNNKYFVIGAVILLLIVYSGVKIFKNVRELAIEVSNIPDIGLRVSTSTFIILGHVDPAAKLLIDDEEVLVSQGGDFQKKVNLVPGLNSIHFSAKKPLGSETTIVKQVTYEISTTTDKIK